MVILSKELYYEKLYSRLNCKDLLHPWTDSCLRASFTFASRYCRGVFYFCLPLYTIKLLIDYKKVNKKYLKYFLKSFMKTQSQATAFAGLTLSTVCVMSNVSDKMNYWGVTLLPGIVAGASIFLEQPETRHIDVLIWMSMLIEAIFHNAYFFKIAHFSRFKETGIFMLTSSVLMYLFLNTDKEKIPRNLWFYKPEVCVQNCSNSKKIVDNQCLKICLKELLMYFGFGFAINSAKFLMSSFGKIFKNPFTILYKSIFNKKSFMFGMFFGVYASTFRVVSCLLHQSNKERSRFNAAAAGFVAGLAYYIKPSLNILAFAITTTIQILCKKFLTIPKSFARLPLLEIIFTLCNGMLFYNRIVALSSCPKSYVKMVQIASGGLFGEIYPRLIKNYLSGL